MIAAVRKNYKSLDVKLLATTVEDFENKKHIDSAYNRNIGTAITYSLFDGKMNLQAGLNKSFVDKKYDDSFYFNGGINVNTKHWKLDNTINSVQDNYLNSLGFFNRMFHEDHQKDTTYRHGLTQILNRYRYWIYPKESKIFNYYFPQVFHKSSFDFKSNLLEFVFGVEMQANHKNSSYSTVFLFYDKINTLYPLRVFSDNPQFSLLPAGFYDYNTIGMYHKTDARKKLQYEIFTKYGGFYNGNQYELWNALNLRLQPILKLRLEYTFRDIKLPDNYGQGTYHLWGLQTDIFFSKNVILTNFFQYNTQSDRVRLNSRIQWIYSPMSSLYFVISEAFQPEAKYHEKLAITLKLTYWLGL